MKRMKRSALVGLVGLIATLGLGAQEAAVTADDTSIPTELAAPAAGATGSALKMGLWVETTSDTTCLTRDIATGEKSGYELDNSFIYTKGNWWLWGEIRPGITLDAEIGVWETTKYLYQADSYADNVPVTTVGDGLQNLASIFFAPFANLSDGGIGMNKLGLTLKTPYVNTRVGIGEVKKNGMASFEGIFNVLDAWDDVGDGFTEVSTGQKIQSIGDKIKLNVLLGLSQMRASRGLYSLADIGYGDLARVVFSLTSTSNSDELFRYDEDNSNAAGAYLSVKPLDNLELRAHGLAWFGTGTEASLKTMAGAAEALFDAGPYKLDLTGKVGGESVQTVWGDDGTLTVDGYSAKAVQWVNLGKSFSIGLQNDFTMNDVSDPAIGLWHLANEPMVDIAWGNLVGVDLTSRLYAVVDTDRIAESTDADKPWTAYFSEAGIELDTSNLVPQVKHIVLDYAAQMAYGDWTGSAWDKDKLYHSLMLTSQITDTLAAGIAGLYRVDFADEGASFVPFGFACEANLKTGIKAIGAPKIWMNFTFGMDPFVSSDDSYTFYRHDDPDNNIGYRSYLLDDLYDVINESHIRFGLIWDL